MKPLQFYQQGAVAGVQKDKYTQLPGFVDCENLDIFSSTQSVKASSWGLPEKVSSDYIDEMGRYGLKANGDVYDKQTGEQITDHTHYNMDFDMEGTNIVKKKIAYDNIENKQSKFGIAKRLFVVFKENGTRETISVFTDRMIANYYKTPIRLGTYVMMGKSGEHYEEISKEENIQRFRKKKIETVGSEEDFEVKERKLELALVGVPDFYGKIWFDYTTGDGHSASGRPIIVRQHSVYDARGDFFAEGQSNPMTIKWIKANREKVKNNNYFYTPSGSRAFISRTYGASSELIVEMTTPLVSETYTYFTPENRTIKFGTDTMVMYNKNKVYSLELQTDHYTVYSKAHKKEMFIPYNALMLSDQLTRSDLSRVAGVVELVEGSIIIANKGDNGYVYMTSGGDISQKFVFPGTHMLNAIKVNNLIYVLANASGVNMLCIFSGGELVRVIGADKHKSEGNSLIYDKEKFNFIDTMCGYRGNVVLATKDNRIFVRGKLNNNSVGVFINKIEADSIDDIFVKDDVLTVEYTKGGKKYRIGETSDRIIQNFNPDFSITYPMAIGSHLVDKSAVKLEVSYMLPNKESSLEARINVNDYSFWTYTTKENIDITEGKYKIDGTEGDYRLVFDGKRAKKLTFTLEGGLPQQVEEKPLKLIKIEGNGPDEIDCESFDHFKFVGEIKSEGYEQKKETFTSITNLCNLPRASTVQVRIDGKGDGKSTPEIFAINLLSDQVNKG